MRKAGTGDSVSPMAELWLADWRRQVGELYGEIRRTGESRDTWLWHRERRDHLFAAHPASPIPSVEDFDTLAYYPHDPAMRVTAELDPDVERKVFEVPLGEDGDLTWTRVAVARFTLAGEPVRLAVYWLGGYGGGIFVPFADATSGAETYGGGRYLYDTIKGADLGIEVDRAVFDFNYAYNPSCAHDPYWVCPLAPLENRLPVPVTAGELVP